MLDRRPLLSLLMTLVFGAPCFAASEVATLPASNDGIPLSYGLFVPDGGGGKLALIVDVSQAAVVSRAVPSSGRPKLARHSLKSA